MRPIDSLISIVLQVILLFHWNSQLVIYRLISIIQVTPPASAFTPATSASGSRKRPRAAAGGGASTSSTATPLLARISLAEMNEVR